MANYYNNLTSSGLTLAKNGLTTSSANTVLLNDKATFDFDDFRFANLPKWSEVATATTGDINIPDCIVDVSNFSSKYSDSSITSFKTGVLLGCNKVTSMSYMFDSCSSLTSLDLSNFNTSNVTSMSSMFDGCSSLTSLDLSNFNTSNVTSMSSMFDGCSSLTSLDLSNFNTSNVASMSYMFDGCSSLTSLDLSNFDTSRVSNMSGMFRGCSSFTSLDVSKFDTRNVTSMSYMFRGCSALTSLDLSSFDTSNLQWDGIEYMFDGCTSLTSVNLSNFNTSNIQTMDFMFSGCSSLTSLDLSSFDTGYVYEMYAMFKGCESLTNLILGNNWGAKLVNQSNESYRTLDLSDTAITKDGAKDILTKLASAIKAPNKPVVIFKSSLGLTATDVVVASNKGWEVRVANNK